MQQRLPQGGLGPRTIVGESAIIADLQATIARLTAELEAEKAKRGAQLESAVWQVRATVPGHMLVGDTERICDAIRALDPDATAALDQIVKQAVDAERERCLKLIRDEAEQQHEVSKKQHENGMDWTATDWTYRQLVLVARYIESDQSKGSNQ